MLERFDVIVIGSGIGGLAAAGILARLKNKRVLVLEKHYVAGGLTHEFHRGKYSWDVGIHYVGGLGPGEQARLLFDLVTGKQVTWNAMPDVFDRFVFPDVKIDVPRDPLAFARNLIAAFPAEEKAIRQYLRDLRFTATWYIADFLGKFADPLVRMPFALRSIGKGRLARMTTRAYMDRSFRDEKLKAVLAAQWGDYGLPPDRSAFALHALVVWSYFSGTGAFFPEGGGRTIAQAAEKVIEQAGGRLQVDTEVTQILVRGNKAYGVRVRRSDGSEDEYHAGAVISNAGAELTFRDLVPRNTCKAARKELTAFEHGTAFIVLYLGLAESPGKFGIQGENYWIYDTYELNGMSSSIAEMVAGRVKGGFLSFPSMKNSQAHGHTAEFCVIVDAEEFPDWANRPAAYYAAKEKIAETLLGFIATHFPGFRDIVDYVELSTPVTTERYTSRPRGEAYGIPGTPARFGLKSLSPRTPIRNLYLSGSDVCSLGIVGALNGGAAAAACVMGPMGFLRIMAGATAAKHRPAPKFDHSGLSRNMISGVVVKKQQRTGAIFELAMRTDQDFAFVPGQHVDLQVTPDDRRSYSVCAAADRVVTLIVDTKPQGPGSLYVLGLAVGDTVRFTPPKGGFRVHDRDTPVCFIATGTGIAPLAPMLKSYLAETHCQSPAKFIFGTTFQADNIAPHYLPGTDAKVDITFCLSREKQAGEHFSGRITDFFSSAAAESIDLANTDFYICGNPYMTHDVQQLLRIGGARNVYTESY